MADLTRFSTIWKIYSTAVRYCMYEMTKILHFLFQYYILLAGQAGVANAGYVQLAHLVMDSQKIGFIEAQTRGSKQKVWNLNHYTMKLD